jgi:hypothetical protein
VKLARREPVVAAFAGILDGRRLWLAVEDTPGSLALRAADSGDVVAPANEVRADDQPGYRAARIDLAELPGGDETTYDVVLVPGRGRPVPVRSEAPVSRRPDASPWRLARTDEGLLQVHREDVPDAAELVTVEEVPEGLRLIVSDGPQLGLLIDDEPVVVLPVHDGAVTLPASDLPEQPARAMVGEPGSWRPLRRRANDLSDPGRGAPLPSGLRWSPSAELIARPG